MILPSTGDGLGIGSCAFLGKVGGGELVYQCIWSSDGRVFGNSEQIHSSLGRYFGGGNHAQRKEGRRALTQLYDVDIIHLTYHTNQKSQTTPIISHFNISLRRNNDMENGKDIL